MNEIIVDGIPVFIKERGQQPRSIRIKLKKSGPKGVKNKPFSKLDSRQKQALENYEALGCDPKKKKEAAVAAGFSGKHQSAVRAMDRLLERRPIVKKIEDECIAKHNKGADEKVAEVLVQQLDADHPLAKDKKPDNLARINAAKEINKIKDNYPPKKVDIREVGFHLHFDGGDIKAGEEYRKLTDGNS